MGRRAAIFAFLVAAVPVAVAQPLTAPTEHVTVTGTRSREVIGGFVQSFVAPTRMTGKIARWEEGICPTAVGLKPAFLKFVIRRLKDVAVQAGAPVSSNTSCKANIEIVFTTNPQALLNGIAKEHGRYLGYADNGDQQKKLATVTHPIQSWYTTATQDLHGKVVMDSGKEVGPGMEVWLPCDRVPGICLVNLPNAHAEAVTGSRIGDGLRSNLYHVIIAANPDKLADYEIGPLADYVAMLALTQLNALDTCQPLPSIVNLLAAGCDRPVGALTENDLAYLRGLYKMGSDRNLRSQQDAIAYQMEQSLEGK